MGEAANGTADIKVEDGASAIIDHVKINGDEGVHACIWHQGTSLVVNAVNCYGSNDGIFSWADHGYSQTTGDHFVITNSYFHDFTDKTSNGHSDGYQTEGASDGLIKHNTYQMTASADSAIALWDSLRDSRNIDVRDNLITGGGFAIYAEDYYPGDSGPGDPGAVGGYSVSDIRFTGNVFSTYAAGCVGSFGVWFERPGWSPYDGGPTDGWHRHGNRVLETGQNVDDGNPSGPGLSCGYRAAPEHRLCPWAAGTPQVPRLSQQHRGDALSGPAVPQGRGPPRRRRLEHAERGLHDPLRIAPDQLIRALGDGDRSLGVVPQREARDAEHRGLLLDAAGVGQHQAGRRLERDEVEVSGGRDDAHLRRTCPAAGAAALG